MCGAYGNNCSIIKNSVLLSCLVKTNLRATSRLSLGLLWIRYHHSEHLVKLISVQIPQMDKFAQWLWEHCHCPFNNQFIKEPREPTSLGYYRLHYLFQS